MNPDEIYKMLKEPFHPTQVHWRVGATNQKAEARRTGNRDAPATEGSALAYINARDVQKRLDMVIGFNRWQSKYIGAGGVVVCELSLLLPDAFNPDAEMRWVTKSDGAGKTSYEGDKGQFSDAFKRAASAWGVGRYLYYLGTSWHPLKPNGKFAATPSLPKWALPTEIQK